MPFASFTAALIAEAGKQSDSHELVNTLYFGGGTPSLLPLPQLACTLEALDEAFELTQVVECSLEINPDGLEPDYLARLCDLGINRLSIGIQSFFQDDLAWMNRAHTEEEARTIIPKARDAGFNNFSIDLIFGLPNQSDEHWKANLEMAVEFDVPHISTYGLTIEPRTPLYKQVSLGNITPVADEAMAAQYHQTMEFLKQAGYEHYEVSSFAKPGFRSQHNQQYWTHENYLGFGPSAHSFWWTDEGAYRWSNARNLRKYIEAGGIAREEPELLSREQLADEYLMLRLRTRDGLDLGHFATKYGVDLHATHGSKLDQLKGEGLVEEDDGTLRLTSNGMAVCDAVTSLLLG